MFCLYKLSSTRVSLIGDALILFTHSTIMWRYNSDLFKSLCVICCDSLNMSIITLELGTYIYCMLTDRTYKNNWLTSSFGGPCMFKSCLVGFIQRRDAYNSNRINCNMLVIGTLMRFIFFARRFVGLNILIFLLCRYSCSSNLSLCILID